VSGSEQAPRSIQTSTMSTEAAVSEVLTDRLSLYVFGAIRVEVNRRPLMSSPGSGRLLAYLGVHPTSAPREEVAAALWPEATDRQASTALRTALTRLRREIGDHWVEVGQRWLALSSEVWTDCRTLAGAVVDLGGTVTVDLYQARSSLALYTADAFRGRYDPWALAERERLRDTAVLGYERLVGRAANLENWDLVLESSLLGLALEPLLETFHRGIILAHGRRGNPAAAIRQYNRLETLLAKELGIQPSEATLKLLERTVTRR
jgi:DNA-binding SARP family transcriptional activator